jgi:hypothetical protein
VAGGGLGPLSSLLLVARTPASTSVRRPRAGAVNGRTCPNRT